VQLLQLDQFMQLVAEVVVHLAGRRGMVDQEVALVKVVLALQVLAVLET